MPSGIGDWPWPVWALYGIGALYLVGFVTSFFRLKAGARRAGSGDAAAVTAYNGMLRGFPSALYARMLGRRPLEVGKDSRGKEPPGPKD